MRIKVLIAAFVLLFPAVAGAQDKTVNGIPPDVYYLMPSFGKGMVYFSGQAPAQGNLNICALDNSLRFLDKDGKELVASSIDNVVKVLIDTVWFVRHNDVFLRLYPLSDGKGVAAQRDIRIEWDTHEGAYGTKSRTSSIREYGTVYTDGVAHTLERTKDYPYSVSETLYLYNGNEIYVLAKKNFRRLFPEKKAEIDGFFKAGNPLPDSVDGALEMMRLFMD